MGNDAGVMALSTNKAQSRAVVARLAVHRAFVFDWVAVAVGWEDRIPCGLFSPH